MSEPSNSQFGKRIKKPAELPEATSLTRTPPHIAAASGPLSLLLLTVFFYILQLNPMLGVGLMLFEAPLWPIVLVNGAMLWLILQVALKQTPFPLVVVPLVYFSVYEGFALNDHFNAYQQRVAATHLNERVHVPFDRNRQVISISGPVSSGYFAETFGLNAVYDSNYKRMLYLVGYMPDIAADIRFSKKVLISRGIKSPGWLDIEQAAGPDLIEVNFKEPDAINIVSNGQESVLAAGNVAVLPWFPLPFGGCSLSDASVSWECGWGFARARYSLTPGDDQGYRTAAKALGLVRAPLKLTSDDEARRLVMQALAAERAAQTTGTPLASSPS